MKKISNREEANNYFKVINNAVNKFSEETKSRPSEMHRYLYRNGKSFLKRLGLDEVEGIQGVLSDVLLHKKHLEEDKIITFESFSKVNEGLLNISSPDVNYEKVLADFHNTSLGHIDLIDSGIHLYRVNDFGKVVHSIIFTKEDINNVKGQLCKLISDEVLGKSFVINSVGNVSVSDTRFWLSEIVENGILQEQIQSKVSLKMVVSFICDSINSVTIESEMFDPMSYSEVDGFYVWTSM